MLEYVAAAAVLVMLGIGAWVYMAKHPKPLAAHTDPEEYSLGYDTGFDEGRADALQGFEYNDTEGDDGPNPSYRRGFYSGYYDGYMKGEPSVSVDVTTE